MAEKPTESRLSGLVGSLAGIKTEEKPLSMIEQMANDELPKIQVDNAASFGAKDAKKSGSGLTFAFSVDGDAIMEGIGIKDGKVDIERLADGLRVSATWRF